MQNSASPASESYDNPLVRPAGIILHQQRDQLLLLRTLKSVENESPTVASAPATPLQNSASELLRVSEPWSFALDVPRFHEGRFLQRPVSEPSMRRAYPSRALDERTPRGPCLRSP